MTKKELDARRYVEQKGRLSVLRAARYQRTRKKALQQTRDWKAQHPHHWRSYDAAGYRVRIKIETLSHYGPDGKLQCAWPDCGVIDVDMLSLDHIHDDGAQERRNGSRGGGGIATYQRLRKSGFPDGFQTLCHNHQWKKEILRRREQNG